MDGMGYSDRTGFLYSDSISLASDQDLAVIFHEKTDCFMTNFLYIGILHNP